MIVNGIEPHFRRSNIENLNDGFDWNCLDLNLDQFDLNDDGGA